MEIDREGGTPVSRPRTTSVTNWVSIAMVLAFQTVSCVSAPEDGVRGLEPYLEGPADYPEAREEIPDDEVESRTDELLDEPLEMDSAVEVAVLNHPRLRADVRQIDVVEGRLRQEARIGNPEVELEAYVVGRQRGDELWEPGVMFDVAGLLDRAGQVTAATSGIEAARVEAAGRIIEFVTRVRLAWIDHVAARQRLERTRRVAEAAEAIAEGARLYYEAGNIAADELRRFEAHSAETTVALHSAEQRVVETGNELHDVLGVDVDRRDWTVPEQLPELPDELPDVDEDAESILERNVDARRLAHRQEELDARGGLERRRGWLPRLDVGAVAEIEADGVELGPALRIDVPIFDRRGRLRDALRAESVQADFEYRQALRAARIAMRDIDERLRRTYDAARQYQTDILPLRRQLVDETLRQYNAMAVSALQLLETRREHLEAERGAVDAHHQFWRAHIDYEHLVAGGIP